MSQEIIIAADHGGFASKEHLQVWLEEQNYRVLDAGATDPDPGDDFPDYAAAAIALWRAKPQRKLVLWCRSGAGMVIAANRIPGIYCTLATPNLACLRAAVRDDHLNALAIPSDFLTQEEQKQTLEVFLQTPYSDEARFTRRLRKLDALA